MTIGFILSPYLLYSQKFLTDTIYIDFQGDSILDVSHLCIKEIVDKRNENPNFVMYQTRNKLLIFPVDLEIFTTKPLTEALIRGLNIDCNGSTGFSLHINKFEIEKRKGRFSSSTFLVADIPVYEYKNDSAYYRGTFYYDHEYIPLNKKESSAGSKENLLYNWHTTFKTDLLRLNILNLNDSETLPANLIIDPLVKPLYLHIQATAIAGLKWYGFQGEMFFTRPEVQSLNKTRSGIVRYQNNPDYESLGIGRNSEHINLRVNKNFLFDADLNILIGFLKWKEVTTQKPTLYQIINAELSSIQSIDFNQQNKKGFTTRIGIMESLAYIYNKKLRFQAGAVISLGYKF